MGVGLQVGSIVTEVGNADFFYAFFSTVSARLEPKGWGTRFPLVITRLYQGTLPASDVPGALAELLEIRKLLERHQPSDVVWNFEDRTALPPWGKNISSEITSLSNYFVTSGGHDLFDVLIEVLEDAREEKCVITVTKTPPFAGDEKVRMYYGTKNDS